MSPPLRVPPPPPPPSPRPAPTAQVQFGVPVLPAVIKPAPAPLPVPSTAEVEIAPLADEGQVDEPETTLERVAAILLKVLWLPFCGIWLGAIYVLVGLAQFVGLITIPLGIQSFKIASYVIWPVGRSVSKPRSLSGLQKAGAVWWFITTGIFAVLLQVVLGIVLCVTIIGVPVGRAAFKLIPLVAAPFGKWVGPSTQTQNATIVM